MEITKEMILQEIEYIKNKELPTWMKLQFLDLLNLELKKYD